MKKILLYIAIALCSCFLLQCSHNLRENTNISAFSSIPSNAFELSIVPSQPEVQADPNAVLEIKDKQSGKKWAITHKQFLILDRSYENWQTVSSIKPIISSVEEKNNKVYITFNYLDKDKKSILSGIVIIDKEKAEVIFDNRRWQMYLLYGLGGYSTFTTILIVIGMVIVL